jgi:hypothetical protein
VLPETVMQNGQNLPRHFDVILGHVGRFETDQKALTPAPAGTAAPTGPATALASPGTSQTELIRVFYAVLYPDFTHTGGILANCRDVVAAGGAVEVRCDHAGRRHVGGTGSSVSGRGSDGCCRFQQSAAAPPESASAGSSWRSTILALAVLPPS